MLNYAKLLQHSTVSYRMHSLQAERNATRFSLNSPVLLLPQYHTRIVLDLVSGHISNVKL